MSDDKRIIALDPTSRGYGFVVFEGLSKLVDWGHTHVRPKKNDVVLESIAALIGRYNPEVVVLEDWIHRTSRRRKRITNLLNDVADFVLASNGDLEAYTPSEIALSFDPTGNITKHEIAETLVHMYPELTSRLPPKRRLWMSEDTRSSIFDAAALALTYYDSSKLIKL